MSVVGSAAVAAVVRRWIGSVVARVRVPWIVMLRRLRLVVVWSLVNTDRATAEGCLHHITVKRVRCDGSADQVVVVLEKILLSIIASGLSEVASLHTSNIITISVN